MPVTIGQIDNALRVVMPKILETEYGTLDFLNLFVPEDSMRMPGVGTIDYYRATGAGTFRVMADYATTAPKVDVWMTKITYDTEYFNSGFDITLKETDSQAFAASNNQPIVENLVERKTKAIDRAYQELQNRILSDGLKGKRLYGLLTHPDVPRAVMPYRFGLTTTAGDNIGLASYISMLAPDRTLGNERPGTLVLPPAMQNELGQQIVSTGGSTSTMKFIKENNTHIKEVTNSYNLLGKGPNGGDLGLLYSRNEESLISIVPKGLTRGLPQDRGHNTEVLFHCQLGGVHFHRPLSATILEFPAA
jgi:hypothetical protein